MKGRVLLIAFGVLALCAFQTHASVFSSSGGGALQNVFNSLGYEYIDVANYQTDLNFRLQGMMEFQLMSRSGVNDLSFGVLESYSFFIAKREGRRTTRFYSYSPFNTNGAVQALFYRDPMDSNSYLLAWNGLYAGTKFARSARNSLLSSCLFVEPVRNSGPALSRRGPKLPRLLGFLAQLVLFTAFRGGWSE